MSSILVLNGPNLGRLGSREPEIYGSMNYAQLVAELEAFAQKLGHNVDVRQTESESELIGWLHEAVDSKTPVVLNPAAFTHYSYALADAAALVTKSGVKLIEVHITNPHAREEFRHKSVVSAVATGVIAGFGTDSYKLAIQAI
jgi:3-dehydroquinate dehydratase-2